MIQCVQRRHLAGNAGDAQAIAAVRREVDIDALVARAQDVTDRRTHRCVGAQVHNAVGVVAHLKLVSGAEHAVGFDAADLALADLHAAGKLGPDLRVRRAHAGVHVGRAADHHLGLAAGAHLTHAELVGAGMRLHREHLAHDHAVERERRGRHAVYLETRIGELGGERIGVDGRVDPLAQPLFTELHSKVA